MDMGYALEDGQSLDFEVTLTGTVSTINTPWSDDYQNITVTMLVEGVEDKPIMCYRLTGEGAQSLAIGDVITVKGTLKNYKGTIEFDAGCILLDVQVGAGSVSGGPTDPGEILTAAYSLGEGQSLPYTSTLTGKIIRVDTQWSSHYKNITVTIAVPGYENMPVMCYRLKGDGAEDLCVEDSITVTGTLKNYYGTIEFDAGCTLVDVVPGPRTPITFPEQPDDVLQIMEDAYELTHGHFLPYNVILTGYVTNINTPWSDRYGNISVTIKIPGAEQYPLLCYRMVGKQYGADTIAVGDTITVHGSVTNYNGTIELAAGCWCYEVIKGEGYVPDILTDEDEILEKAFELEEGESMTETSMLTGVITEVNTPYDSYWDNVTVTMQVQDKYIKCYRLAGDGVDVIGVGDTITVSGIIKNFYGTVEYDQGCTLVSYVLADDTEDPTEPTEPVEVPDADTELTILEAIELGESMDHNTYTEGKYYVTGVITKVYNTTYGNMYIKDSEGNILTIYGTYDADGTNRYDAMTTKPVAGDTVKLYGIIGQYNGTAQMKNGWIVEHTPGTETPEETEPVEDPAADSTLSILEAIELGESKDHNTYTEGKYYVTGVITSVYNTTYGNMYIQDASGNTLTIYGTYDADGTNRYDAMTTKPVAGDTVTVYGIIGQYNGTAQMKNGWITAHTPAETEPETTEPEETEPEETEPETTEPEATEPAANSTLSILEAIELGESKDHNTYTEGKYYVTGVITSVYNTTYGNMYIQDASGNTLTIYGTYDADGTNRYDAMTTKPVAGDTVTVYGIIGQYNGTAQMKNGWITAHTPAETDPEETEPEETVPAANSSLSVSEAIELGESMDHNTYTEGKYYVTGVITQVYNTTYGNMYIQDSSGNTLTIYGTYDADGSNRYDAMTTKPVAGDTVTVYGIIGQYNGTAQMKNGWITAHTPAETETTDPAADSTLTIAEAAELGVSKGHNTYTEGKYYVTGVISNVANTTYGNMTITDESGNSLYIYGTYDADGSNRYDAMTTKPVAGDTVTVYGILGQYNGTAQMKNGWIVVHTPG